MKSSNLRTVGITLWWAEGTKSRRDKRWKTARSYPIELTNTNPMIIKTFLEFIRKEIKPDEKRIKAQLQIHEGDNQRELEKYWSKITRIPLTRFNKTIIKPTGNKIGKSRGTCKIRYADKETYSRLEKILAETLGMK
jgi:hypothetical protein